MASILRSSKYVRNFAELVNKLGVIKFKRNIRVNISETHKSGPLTLARSLTTQIAAQKLDNDSSFEYNLQKLDNDVKKFGRISRTKFEHILNEFHKSKSVTSTQALMLLQCCGSLMTDELPQFRSELVNEIWKTLENSGIQLEIAHYNALLRVYIENNYPYSPAEILADLERKGIEPNKLTHQRLITRYCEQGDIQGASKILEFMKEKGMPINENIFTALVRGHVIANDMNSAIDILSVMRQAGLEPSADHYKELVCGYAKHGNTESITKTLSECRSNNVQLLDTDYLDIVSSLASGGHNEHIESILSIMPRNFGYLQNNLNHIVKLVQAGHIKAAKLVLNSIPNRDKGVSGGAAIKQLAKCDLPAEMLVELCKNIEAKGIHTGALMIALEITLTRGNTEASLALIDALHEAGKEIREHYFWPILVVLGRSKNHSAVNDVLRTMRSILNDKVSSETITDYVVFYKTDEPEAILVELSIGGVTTLTIACAITYNLIAQSKLKEAAAFAHKYSFRYTPLKFVKPLTTALSETKDVKSYVSILHRISHQNFKVAADNGNQNNNEVLEPYLKDMVHSLKNHDIATLSEVFLEMSKTGLIVSNSTLMRLEKAIGREMRPVLLKSLNNLKYREFLPRIGNYTPSSPADCQAEISRVEASLSESTSHAELILKKKRLLFLYSYIKDLPNLERIEREFKEQEIPFGQPMYKRLMYGYLASNAVEKVVEYLRCIRLTNPAFELPDSKLIEFITFLVNNGHVRYMVKFLEEEKRMQMDSRTSNIHWRIMNALAELGNVEAVDSVFNMFLKKGYISISNAYLAPLVKVHICRGDLETALNVIEKFCEKYRLIPCKNELAKKFIEVEDATALQRLTDLSTQVHGESNSLYDLAESFIEMNCLRQAKKILEIPALRGKINKLILASKRFRDQGQTDYSERLIAVIRDVPHLKELPEFYNDLLSCYVSTKNWEKGLNLWQQMLDEDIKPSNIFLVTLANLLKSNKQPIPYPVPELSDDENQQMMEMAETESMLKGADRQSKNSKLIENLLRDNKLNKAYEVLKSVPKNEFRPLLMKFKSGMTKMAYAGDTESLENLSKRLSLHERQLLGIDFNICLAYVESGRSEEYLDILERKYGTKQSDESDQTVGELLLFGIRKMFAKHPELIERYTKFAEDCAAKGILLPMNVLWMYYFIQRDTAAADKIWSEHMINKPQLRFHGIVRMAVLRNEAEMIEALLDKLETSSMENYQKGYIYSELIRLYIKQDKLEESKEAMQRALARLSVEDLQLQLIVKFQKYLESKSQKLPDNIVEKINPTDAATPDKV